MKYITIIFITFLVFYGNIIVATEFVDCGSSVGKFTKIEISDCDTTKSDCILKRNSNVSITIDFTLNEDCDQVNTIVHGKIFNAEIPFNLENPDACIDSGLVCPLKKGTTYEYKATLPVLKIYPKIKLHVKWELQDKDKNDIVCVLIPAKIQ